MLQNIVNWILLGLIIGFIFMVNALAMKKKTAAQLRIMAEALKLRISELPVGEESARLTQKWHELAADYRRAAAAYNQAISSPMGKILNLLLRYPAFPNELTPPGE